MLLKTLSLTVSKPETGRFRWRLSFTIYTNHSHLLSKKMSTKPEICTKDDEFKEYKTKFRLNISFTLTLTLFPTGTKRNLFFQKRKKHFCKWLNEYDLHKASFLRSFLRVTFSPHFISLDGSPVRLKNV